MLDAASDYLEGFYAELAASKWCSQVVSSALQHVLVLACSCVCSCSSMCACVWLAHVATLVSVQQHLMATAALAHLSLLEHSAVLASCEQ